MLKILQKGTVMKKDQNGFSALETLLILLVVGIIAGIGWFVYRGTKQTTDVKNETTQTQSTPQDQATYLDIKEWGVKFTVPAGYDKELNYARTQVIDLSQEKGEFYGIGYKKIEALTPDCNDWPFILVQRVKAADDDGTIKNDKLKSINGYNYYSISGPQEFRCTSDQAIITQASQILDQLPKPNLDTSFVKTIQAD
jgi:type II secretory pathway pseudopilin PulG